MATITGYTAEKMEEMRKANVVDARLEVSGDERQLVLIPDGFDEEPLDYPEINVGDVRGPAGLPGVTEVELDAFLAAYELKTTPIGSITDFVGTTAPTNWLKMEGQAVIDGETLYPELWAILPASMKVGSTISMPDTRGRITVGLNSGDASFDTIGKTGGSKDAVVVSHTHAGPSHTHTGPSHTHTINHDHAVTTTGINGAHSHEYEELDTLTSGVAGGWGSGTKGFDNETTSEVVGHVHSVDIPAYSGSSGAGGTGNTGAGGTGATSSTGEAAANKNLQPYITFTKIIRAA